jgi:hypothetical protein
MQTTTRRPKITVTADRKGMVSHTGSRLLAELAEATTLTDELSDVFAGLRLPHDLTPRPPHLRWSVISPTGSPSVAPADALAEHRSAGSLGEQRWRQQHVVDLAALVATLIDSPSVDPSRSSSAH